MSLGALTLTLVVNAENKVLRRINQDKYQTEYWLREATQEFRVFVRHSVENFRGVPLDRHNVEVIQEVFATPTSEAKYRTAYMVIRHSKTDDYTAVGYIPVSLADFTKAAGNVSDLLAWVG